MDSTLAPPKQDALALFSSALSAPNADVESRMLGELYALFESQPSNLPILFPSIVPLLDRARETLRKWIVDVMDLAFCKGVINIETRNSLAMYIPEAVLSFVREPGLPYAKPAIQCFASAYQAVFRQICNDRSQVGQWKVVEAIKHRLVEMFDSNHGGHGSIGIKVAIIKAYQRIILVQNRTTLDARGYGRNDDVHLGMVPPNHPVLRASLLEAEAKKLLTSVVTLQFTSNNTDLVMAAMNTLSTLAKSRPALGKIVCEAMVSWTPVSLAGCSYNRIRNVEKTLRLNYFHLLKHSAAGSYDKQIANAIEAQKTRMEAASITYNQARDAEAKRKRDHLADEIAAASKRPKLELATAVLGSAAAQGVTQSTHSPQETARAFMNQRLPQMNRAAASFDVTTLPLQLVVDLVIANLQSISDETLQAAMQRTRANLAGTQPVDDIAPPLDAPKGPAAQLPTEAVVNPLKMDVEEVELDNLPLPAAETVDADEEAIGPGSKLLENFELAAPEVLAPTQALELVKGAVGRMCKCGAQDWTTLGQQDLDLVDLSRPLAEPALWASLVIRLATRGFSPTSNRDGHEEVNNRLINYSQDIREVAHTFVRENPKQRIGFANYWLMEEWACDRQRRKDGEGQHYERLLLSLLDGFLQNIDAKDRWLATFVLDLPELPATAVEKIKRICMDKATMPLGFGIMRDIAMSRPPARKAVSEILLRMTRSTDGLLRRGAITSARAWVGQGSALEGTVLAYARDSLQCLVQGMKAPDDEEVTKADGDQEEPKEKKEEQPSMTQEGESDPVTTWSQLDVLRYLELDLALCIKVPSLLNEIFGAYPSMPTTIQSAVEKHIAPLVSSMGPNNPKLQALLRNFPIGADTLALSVFQVLSDKGSSPALVSLVKSLVSERDVDPRFLVPIMPDLSKTEILKYLPRVISILNACNTEENVDLVKSVFQSIVVTPAEGFGSISTNLPRLKHTELLTPTELMGLLHRQENEIGIKAAAQAVEICFNLTTVFRSEVLGAILNQIVEEPTLPTIFLRTVIRAVDRYRSLSTYVSGNLLSRLITKKIWLDPQLWKGFILCAKKTAPGSYGALAQLPKEQIKDVALSNPDLKTGLQEYFMRRAGNNPARLNSVMELLGGDAIPAATPTAQTASPVVSLT
ncbi:hypothetical protein K437DRAFT_241987 [Tilletiaria anomala UBC 951]|uniref:Symplekin n=1 Tax=Tilletiaria anomala (strain ATCC 24038 / CBS 436.72 / UBC 951) TaxID=1037660 RepID=A0A066WLD8_TILAU|nr:uncharacterized protein K437DRAFT_241987 [Tilletiaria anomala UBC 951]KDN53383.1 hypothetical protein K437DRAFT_241987 [Tilletiaria anomala UBC 951]